MSKNLLIILLLSWIFFSLSPQAQPNFDAPIELIVERIGKVHIFEDLKEKNRNKKQDKSQFWYLPEELRIQRRNYGSLSRQAISLEDFLIRDEEHPTMVLLRCQLDPALSKENFHDICKAINKAGYGKFNPFNPNEPLINLNTVTPLKIISFDLQLDLIGSEEQAKAQIPSQIDMTRSIPFSVLIPNHDANALARILQERKSLTIGVLNAKYANTTISIPAILSLDLASYSLPFEYKCKYNSARNLGIELKNRTEHEIAISSLRYREKGKQNQFQSCSLVMPSHTNSAEEPQCYFISLSKLQNPDHFQLIQFEYSIKSRWDISLNWCLRHHYVPLEYEVIACVDPIDQIIQKIERLELHLKIIDENNANHLLYFCFESNQLRGNKIIRQKQKINQKINFKNLKFKISLNTKEGENLSSQWADVSEGNFGQNKAILRLNNYIYSLLPQFSGDECNE